MKPKTERVHGGHFNGSGAWDDDDELMAGYLLDEDEPDDESEEDYEE